MDWVRHGASKREFDCFAAETWDPLLRTGYLMTGDAKDAEDLIQETLLKVARRWNPGANHGSPGRLCPPDPDQTSSCMTPAAHPGGRPNSGRRTAGLKLPTRARHRPCERSMTRPSSLGAGAAARAAAGRASAALLGWPARRRGR
jgi:hypothetical protein